MRRHRLFRFAAGAALACALLVAAYMSVTAVQVWRASGRDDATVADAIVVLGAAQYDGRPSPVLKGRLDHALQLYEDGMAPLIVVTGGRRDGDRFTEAWAGASYLQSQGVPGAAIERETTGVSSYESLAAAARFLRERDMDEVILVSDPFHNYRIGAIAREVGLRAHVSGTTTSPIQGSAKVRQIAREAVAVSLGRVIGYRRLTGLGLRLDQAGIVGRP